MSKLWLQQREIVKEKLTEFLESEGLSFSYQQVGSLMCLKKGKPEGWFGKRGHQPGPDELMALGKLLNLPADWLLYGEMSVPNETKKNEISSRDPPLSEEQADVDVRISDLITKTIKVLESKTVFRQALAANINAFSLAVNAEREMENLKSKTTEQGERLAKLENKVSSIFKDNGSEPRSVVGKN